MLFIALSVLPALTRDHCPRLSSPPGRPCPMFLAPTWHVRVHAMAEHSIDIRLLVRPGQNTDVSLEHFLDLGGRVALEETLEMHKDDQHM